MKSAKTFNFAAALGILMLITLVLSGCGYKLQTRADLPFDSIAIGPVENKTFEPKLEDRMHRAAAEAFMEYGFRISPSARYVLESSLREFSLKPLSEKELTASEYEVSVRGVFRLRDKDTGTVRELSGESPFVTYLSATGALENLTSKKELATDRALKETARELARKTIYGPVKKK